MLEAPKIFSLSNDKSATKMTIVKYYMKISLSSSRIEKSSQNTLPKPMIPIDLKMFCLSYLIFSCVYSFFHKKMKFYEGISPYQNTKALNTLGVFYIHFLSKIFFMIKWIKGFFILMWRFVLHKLSGTSAAILEICSIY